MRKIAKKVKHRISNLDRSNFKRPQFLVFVLGFALIGTYLLFQSLAAVNFLKVEAEVVAPVGNATRVPAANASGSGNNVVQFGAASSAPIRYEAENAAHDPNSVVENKPSGGVLGSFGHQGQFVTFTVSVQNTGDYAAVLRYAAADGTATKLDPLPRTLLINNVQIRNIDFPRTSSASDQWDTLTTKSIDTLHLTGGTPNTVTFRIDTTQEGYWDVDYLEVAGATGTTPPPPPTCPPGTHGTPPDNCVPDTVPPTTPPGTIPVGSGGDLWVSNSGSDTNSGTQVSPLRDLQTAVDRAVPGNTIHITGSYTCVQSPCALLINRDNNGNWITIKGESGASISADTGIEGYGSSRWWIIRDLTILVNHGNVFGEGVYFDGGRADKTHNGVTSNGAGAAYIIVHNNIVHGNGGDGQRNGIGVWGADHIEIGYNTVSNVAYNAIFGFGSAGSGISVGIGIRYDTVAGTHVFIHHNRITTIHGDGSVSADRNGIIMDLFQSSGGSPYSNHVVGDIIVEYNVISDVVGRGIQILRAGLPDSPVYVRNNTVVRPFADMLGGSAPETAIGGYGSGVHSNVHADNNLVYGDNTQSNYFWLSFDAAPDGVKGANNWSFNGSVLFDGTAQPAGFIAGTADPKLVNPAAGTGDYHLQSGSPLTGRNIGAFP